MRYLTLFVLFIILSACGKKSTTTTPSTSSTTATLNSTESQMTYKWYLKAVSDSDYNAPKFSPRVTGQSYSGITNNQYIEFKNTAYTGGTSTDKECYDKVNLSSKPSFGFVLWGMAPGNSKWSVDTVNNELIVSDVKYKIINLSSTELTIKYETTLDTTKPNVWKSWRIYTFSK